MKALLVLVGLVLASILLVSPSVSAADPDPESKSVITQNDNRAKRDVINKFDTWTNLSYASKVKKVIVEDYENNSKVLIDRLCPYGQNFVNGTCIIPNKPVPPVVTPPSPPTNVSNATAAISLVFAGDVEGTSVRDGIKKANADFNTVAGDLGYDSSLSWFKTNYVNVFGSKLGCVIGNHDAPEDGSSSIYTEAKKLCKELWFKKIGGANLIIGFNSNGDIDTQLGEAQKYVTNSTNMQGIKNVFIASHKPAHTAPNSHHPVSEDPEVKTFVDSLKSKLPSTVKAIEVNAHNHVLSKAPGKYYTSGAGGKSHYECGNDSTWTFCNNTQYGYLKFEIDSKGQILSDKFYSSSGSVIG